MEPAMSEGVSLVKLTRGPAQQPSESRLPRKSALRSGSGKRLDGLGTGRATSACV
jgi:hypothetical protein